MVKSKFSATYAERIYTPTLSVKWSSMPMEESEVDGLIEAAIEEGAIVYEKPLDDKSLVKDFFAHAALYRDGWEFSVIKESREHKNIDLMLNDGTYWEIKSPVATGKGKDPLQFVEKRLQEARHQFRSHPETDESETRVVFNCKYTSVSDNEIAKRIRKEMREQGVLEVVQVRKDGTVKRIKA